MVSINFRIIMVVMILALSFVVLSTDALAKSNNGTTKPGWGFGDVNHIHTGPPGQSVHPVKNTQTNNVQSNITLGFSSNTGGNSANGNGGNASVVSGAVSTVVSLVLSLGQNIFGS
jgi:hypothetical protein